MSSAGALGGVGFLADEMAAALATMYAGLASPRLAASEFGITAPLEVIEAQALSDAYEVARAAAQALPWLRDAQADAVASDDVGAVARTSAALITGLGQVIATASALAPALATAAASLPVSHRAEMVELADALPARLIERALVAHLEHSRPRVAQVLYAAGVLTVEEVADGPVGSLATAYTRVHFHGDRLIRLVRDPLGLLRDVHGWGESTFDGVSTMRAIFDLWTRVAHRPAQLLLPAGAPAGLELFVLALHVDNDAAPPGLVASVRSGAAVTVEQTDTEDDWAFGLAADIAVPIDLDVALRPPETGPIVRVTPSRSILADATPRDPMEPGPLPMAPVAEIRPSTTKRSTVMLTPLGSASARARRAVAYWKAISTPPVTSEKEPGGVQSQFHGQSHVMRGTGSKIPASPLTDTESVLSPKCSVCATSPPRLMWTIAGRDSSASSNRDDAGTGTKATRIPVANGGTAGAGGSNAS